MKKKFSWWIVGVAVAFQAYMLTRCPANLGMEVILAGRAMHQGLVLYRDFPCHYGPVMPILFWVLRPGLFGAAVIYGLFNLATAWGIYNLGNVSSFRGAKECTLILPQQQKDCNLTFPFILAALLFLLIKPWFFGDAWNVETPMVCFGVWAFYLAATGHKRWAAMMVVLAFLTKQQGILYGLCLI